MLPFSLLPLSYLTDELELLLKNWPALPDHLLPHLGELDPELDHDLHLAVLSNFFWQEIVLGYHLSSFSYPSYS